MENEYISKNDQLLIIRLGYNLERLRDIKKKAVNSSERKEAKENITVLSDALIKHFANHIQFNTDDDIVFTKPIDAKKIANKVNKEINTLSVEKTRVR